MKSQDQTELNCIASVKGRARAPSTLAQEAATQPSNFRCYRVRENPDRLYMRRKNFP